VNEISFEPERYELHALTAALSRRGFLKALGTGIVVFIVLRDVEVIAQESGGGRGRRAGQRLPQEIAAWIHIAEDGTVTAYTGKVEVGQGSRTELTQVVAEELRVPLASVRMIMGDTDLVPFDAGTFGSQTTPQMVPRLRRAAAAARDVLIGLAADEWKADRASIVCRDGKLVHADRSLTYGQLTKGQKITKVIPDDIPLTPADRWTVAGQPTPRIDGKDFVTGKHKFPSDIKRPGLLHGKVLRPPAFGATLRSVSGDVVHDGNFVGVTAESELAATRALAAIHAEWKTTPQVSASELFAELKQTAGRSDDRGRYVSGSMDDGMAAADKKLQQTYTVAYIAHAPLEPRAAVAEWNGDQLTVWTGTQRPFGVRSELAGAFGIPAEKVRVLVPDTGSGYGGKHTGETAIEAARLAKAAGQPVKVVWTREEEFTWAYFRPAGVIEVFSGAKTDGTLTAWEFHNYNSGAAAIRTPYDVPNQRIEFHPSRSPLRQGSYRALAATANHFARETHMDELARELRMDPLEFRRKNLNDARLAAVLDAAAKAFGWSRRPKGSGIAAGFDKGGYLATCAEVAVTGGTVKIVRLAAAFECGAIINPDNLRNQIEGAIIMGLGGALREAIEFENGRILNPHFSAYPVPRFSDVPEIEIAVLDRKDLPSAGAGETPIVGVAPAIGNAIFDATGIRLRSLPLIPHGLKQGD
jgi:nicotinate dehydrogenase subunit B